jgi:NADH-quinone oxidoreductase subunit C
MDTPLPETPSAPLPFAAENVLAHIAKKFPADAATLVTDTSSAAQHSILLANERAAEIAAFLRDDSELRLDYCSNVTGLDWLDKEVTDTEKVSEPDPAGGPAKLVDKRVKRIQPGYLEAVYHLYSVEKKSAAPVVIRLRTRARDASAAAPDATSVPSLTPVWRSCELQEREVFDLFGIVFSGHPDLRRLLMWDEFKDFPMRKDYVEPDDYEWEPTPHDTILAKAKKHWPANAPTPPEDSRGDAAAQSENQTNNKNSPTEK